MDYEKLSAGVQGVYNTGNCREIEGDLYVSEIPIYPDEETPGFREKDDFAGRFWNPNGNGFRK